MVRIALLISSLESFSLQDAAIESGKKTFMCRARRDAVLDPPREEDVAVLSSAAVDQRQLFDLFRAQRVVLGLFLRAQRGERSERARGQSSPAPVSHSHPQTRHPKDDKSPKPEENNHTFMQIRHTSGGRGVVYSAGHTSQFQIQQDKTFKHVKSDLNPQGLTQVPDFMTFRTVSALTCLLLLIIKKS